MLLCFFPILTHSQSITNGLLLYYKLDANAIDFSSNGLNGTVNGPVAVDDEALNPNSAFFFDGINDFIDLPNSPMLRPSLPFSYSLRVKFESIQTQYSNMFTTDNLQNNYHGSWCNLVEVGQAGKVAVSYAGGLGNTGSNNRRTKLSEETVVSQKWYWLTFVVRGTTDMDIYIDCVNAGGSYSGSGSTQIAYSNVPGSIGRKDGDTGGASNYFHGTIDDVALWDRALSQSEVESLCNGILGVKESVQNTNQGIHLYPNPTIGDLTVTYDNKENQSCEVRIFDIHGRQVFSQKASSDLTLLPLTGTLSRGLYFCQVFNEVESIMVGTARLVIE